MGDPFVRGILSNLIGLTLLFGVSWMMGLVVQASIALGMNWGVFLLHAMPNDSERFFDATGSLTYFTLVVSAVAMSYQQMTRPWEDPRKIVNPIMVIVWCIRLGSYLFARISKDGKDSRFDELKKSKIRFLGIWTLQSVWCFVVSSPALIVVTSGACGGGPTLLDVAGWLVWFVAFLFEVVADRQKDAFRKDPNNKGKFITTGLWAHSRHPNYFGEILMWVGMCISGCSCFEKYQYLAWLSPALTWLLLMKVSGVPLLEEKGKKTWGGQPEYEWYMAKTPCIIPSLTACPQYSAEEYTKLSG